MIVAKVGGSLYDDPRLGPGLRAWLTEQPEPVLLVPGGGPFADAVRSADRVHGLGDEAAHWLAIRAMELAGEFLRNLLHPLTVQIADVYNFARQRDSTPHTWTVTSDSLAALIAGEAGARRLVLLKSVDAPVVSWTDAAAVGFVDGYFPAAVSGAGFEVVCVNARRWWSDRFAANLLSVPGVFGGEIG